MSNINVTIRMDKDKIEQLKDIARERSFVEKINITYNDLIVASVYKEYFCGEKEK
jgi:hypothetical protein